MEGKQTSQSGSHASAVKPPLSPLFPQMLSAMLAWKACRGLGSTFQEWPGRGSRLGIYFLEAGSNQRPSLVIYDRASSAIAEARPGDIDWDDVLRGASWFHVTGITPAISSSAAELSLEAVKSAQAKGLTLSCDLNYRKNLWRYGRTAPEVMREILPYVNVAIANEEDCQKSLGIEVEIDTDSGRLEPQQYRKLAEKVQEAFPTLSHVAITLRESVSADHNRWSGVLLTGGEFYASRKYEIRNIIDRVGTGDTFASGLIYGLTHLAGPKEALEFATAASCLKHSIPGDLPLLSVAEVTSLVGGTGSGRVQR